MIVGSDPPPMLTTTGTLCHVFSHGSLLLIRKSKGLFGEGRWNAPGGKLKPGEGIEGCAIREVLEETGLEVRALEPHGELKFHFGPRRDPDWIVHVFSTRSFSGSLRSGPEGEVRWFGLHEIPYDEMWEDDRYWLPLVFRGKRFTGAFYFDDEGDRLLDHCLMDPPGRSDGNRARCQGIVGCLRRLRALFLRPLALAFPSIIPFALLRPPFLFAHRFLRGLSRLPYLHLTPL